MEWFREKIASFASYMPDADSIDKGGDLFVRIDKDKGRCCGVEN